MVGITLGVAALIVVLSVMNGFQKELRATILGVVSHVQVLGANGRLASWSDTMSSASALTGVRGVAPFVNGEGLLTHGRRSSGALIRGVDPLLEEDVSEIHQHIISGELGLLKSSEFNTVLGIDLARSLGVNVGDTVVLLTPQGNVTPAGVMPRLRQFTVVGILEVKKN
ncbi:MAG: ABC transporter permease [Candidatus Poseidoniales archaeon]